MMMMMKETAKFRGVEISNKGKDTVVMVRESEIEKIKEATHVLWCV